MEGGHRSSTDWNSLPSQPIPTNHNEAQPLWKASNPPLALRCTPQLHHNAYPNFISRLPKFHYTILPDLEVLFEFYFLRLLFRNIDVFFPKFITNSYLSSLDQPIGFLTCMLTNSLFQFPPCLMWQEMFVVIDCNYFLKNSCSDSGWFFNTILPANVEFAFVFVISWNLSLCWSGR